MIASKIGSGLILNTDALNGLKSLPDESVDTVITSPPYYALRDYGVKGQLGLEPTYQEYINNLLDIFDEVKRVLKPSGTLWVNLGDSYYKKSLRLIPEYFVIGMAERDWIVRNKIIWHKPNAIPSFAKDKFTVDFENIYLFTKEKKYYFKQQTEPLKYPQARGMKFGGNKARSYGNNVYSGREYDASKLKGRNKRTVWSITTKPFKGAHFAVFPPEIPRTCIDAGCPESGVVLDPFFGSGTTGVVAEEMGRKWIGIELNPEYVEIAKKRINEIESRLI